MFIVFTVMHQETDNRGLLHDILFGPVDENGGWSCGCNFRLLLANCFWTWTTTAYFLKSVFILADDYGFNDIGYHNPRIKTPNLDSLAASGVRLENYYVQPICTPTRSQLFSGRYQIHTGLQHGIIWPSQANALPKNDTTIANKLKESGYSTHMVGKWHIGFYKREFIPTQRGFDSFFGYLTGGEDYYSHKNSFGFPGKGYVDLNGYDMRRNEDVASDVVGNYSTFLFTNEAVKIISSHETDKSLFLFVAYQAVHSPLEVPEQYTEMYKDIDNRARRTYAGMVTCMDEGIGNITKALQEHGFWDDTVLFFSTDNGGQIYAGGNNFPLRGWKGSLWEGGTRGIGFVYSKLLSKPGEINTELIHVTDWFPTIVHLSGGSVGDLPLDGYNVWGTLSNGEPSPRKDILHNIDPIDEYWDSHIEPYKHCRQAAIRVGDWKLLTGCPGNSSWIPPPESSYSFDHPPNIFDNINSTFLFNIREDPEERNELSKVYPEKVAALMQRLREYNATAVPVCYPDPDPASKPELHGNVWTPWVK